jgi:hypothetical protein
VKKLYVSDKLVPRMARLARTSWGKDDRSVAHSEEYFLGEFFAIEIYEDIETFVAARRLTSHTVAVSRWDRQSQRETFHW